MWNNAIVIQISCVLEEIRDGINSSRANTQPARSGARWEKSKSRSNHENCFANAAEHDKVEFNCAMFGERERNVYTNLPSTVRPEPSGMDANQQQPHRRENELEGIFRGRPSNDSSIFRAHNVVLHMGRKKTKQDWAESLFSFFTCSCRSSPCCMQWA